jgi:hypothetical protein
MLGVVASVAFVDAVAENPLLNLQGLVEAGLGFVADCAGSTLTMTLRYITWLRARSRKRSPCSTLGSRRQR